MAGDSRAVSLLISRSCQLHSVDIGFDKGNFGTKGVGEPSTPVSDRQTHA
jgi:hypothetical protein